MSNYSRIPVKTKCKDALSAIEFEVDTQGLDCVIRADGTNLLVYTKSGAAKSEMYLVKDGETFEFCGKLYYQVYTSGMVYTFMYNRL